MVSSNLVYDETSENKTVKWGVNLEALQVNVSEILDFEEAVPKVDTSALMHRGELSFPVTNEEYHNLFPNADIWLVEGAGHYLHSEKPLVIGKFVADFLDKIDA